MEKVRRHTKGNLSNISIKTLKLRIGKTVEIMENYLEKTLPKSFGITFDGWSEFGVHYLGVFAVGPGVPNDRKVLLGFSPFELSGEFY